MDGRDDSLRAGVGELRLSDAIIATDVEGRIYWTNRAFRRLCGYSKGEVFGRSPDEFLGGEGTDPKALKAIRSAFQNGESLNVEVLNYHKSGRPYRVSMSLNPTRAHNGRLTGFIAMEQLVDRKGEEGISLQKEPHYQTSYLAKKRRRKRAIAESFRELR